MICTCKYYITLSSVELFKVLEMQRLFLQLGTINLMLLSNLKFWFIVTVDKDFWEKFILWKLYFIFQLWKVPIKSILFTGRSMCYSN